MAFALDFPPDLVEAIARRAAELLREQHHPQVPDYLATGEAADYLRRKPQRVFDLVSQGRLPVCKDGSRNLYRRVDLDAYLSGDGRRPS